MHSRKLFIFLWLYLLVIPPANAYIDPSSSLLVIQGLLALVGGIIAFIKHPLKKLRSLWNRISGKRDA